MPTEQRQDTLAFLEIPFKKIVYSDTKTAILHSTMKNENGEIIEVAVKLILSKTCINSFFTEMEVFNILRYQPHENILEPYSATFFQRPKYFMPLRKKVYGYMILPLVETGDLLDYKDNI